jgi:hypothetical protein
VVSTWSSNGVANCAPFSFFNVISEEPPLCILSFNWRSDREIKHTLKNIRRTGEFPQAVRNVLPDLLSDTLEVIKLTALGSVVAMPELLFQARQAQSVTYNPTPIVLATLVYFVMLWPLVPLLSWLENRIVARA